jgi:hypothetical protein
MILGMSLSTFTTVHVIISLVAILSGFVAVYGMLTNQRLDGWTALFLTTTVLTSVTGFLFPLSGVTPAVVVGILSLIVLALALAALYVFRLGGAWRWLYVVTAFTALWFNTFVAVVQAFQKLAFLQPLAPTQSEPPFAIAQVVVLAIFLWLGYRSVKAFHPPMSPAGS